VLARTKDRAQKKRGKGKRDKINNVKCIVPRCVPSSKQDIVWCRCLSIGVSDGFEVSETKLATWAETDRFALLLLVP
jgi:hypothetical protein